MKILREETSRPCEQKPAYDVPGAAFCSCYIRKKNKNGRIGFACEPLKQIHWEMEVSARARL